MLGIQLHQLHNHFLIAFRSQKSIYLVEYHLSVLLYSFCRKLVVYARWAIQWHTFCSFLSTKKQNQFFFLQKFISKYSFQNFRHFILFMYFMKPTAVHGHLQDSYKKLLKKGSEKQKWYLSRLFGTCLGCL